MKIPLLKTIPLLLGSFALTAQAVPIAGQINITGSNVTLVPPNSLGAVTAVNATTGTVSAVETNASYPLSLVGDTVTYSGFGVNLLPQSLLLWTVTDVGGTGFSYSFNLSAFTSIIQTPFNLFLVGTGILSSTNPGLDPTPSQFTYGINSANGSGTGNPPVFSFQSNNVGVPVAVNTPDGGDALILFGAGILSLAGLARRFGWAA